MVSVRREGSSKFGNNNKWGTFPSISAGWTISNESFMKDVTWLDNLKLRAGLVLPVLFPVIRTSHYINMVMMLMAIL